MVRCMGHYKSEIDTDNVSHQKCNITDSPVCNTKADVIFLIQDSQGTSQATVGNIKTVVKRMLTHLSSESTDFNFALANYASSARMSCFGTAQETINYIDNEYQHGGSGRNRLKRALSKMVLKQFEKRPSDRKTDTAKILVIFSDGNTVDKNGDIMDTFQLEKTARLLRVDNKIKIAGALIPNTENTPRIQELKGIATEPDDAIEADFSAYLDKIVDLLETQIKRFACPYGFYFCTDKTDVIFLLQDSQGISSETVENFKTVLKKIKTKLSGVRADFNFAVAKYATSRQMSCFGSADETVSYMDNEYQHGGSGLNLLKLALSKMVLRQFEKRPDDRKVDTSKILVIFSDGNAQNENGDIMDTSTLEQTANSLKGNNIDTIGVLIHNTEKASRIQQLKSIASKPDDVIDMNGARVTSYNNIADRLAFRVKRLVGCLVKYTVRVNTPDSHVKSDYELTVRIRGQGKQKTADHVFYETTQVRKNNLYVIVSEFYDVDVGTVKRIEIKPRRVVNSFLGTGTWNLNEAQVTKGDEIRTAVFKETIPVWPRRTHWYSASARLNPYVSYSVRVYGSDTDAENINSVAVRIIGKDDSSTKLKYLTDKATEGNQLVIKGSFRDINVGPIEWIWVKPRTSADWTLKEIKITRGEEIVTVVFNEEITAWAETNYRGRPQASSPPSGS
ncbi:uncharacterized protein [Montipora foliosa]|uniref:uncharacterized protein n=1 Tax=Montipora foliosa TaxID=591990 RepID=UPI0035F1B74C